MLLGDCLCAWERGTEYIKRAGDVCGVHGVVLQPCAGPCDGAERDQQAGGGAGPAVLPRGAAVPERGGVLDRDERAREHAGAIPPEAQHADIIAYLPLPASWSQKKRQQMAGTPHRVKPDIDNLIKSCLDALLSRDQGIHEIRARKRWEDANGPRVEITIY